MGQAWEFELRECGPEDAERLAVVGAASFLEAFAGFLHGEDILEHCRKQHSEEKYRAMLADGDTRIVVAEVKGSAVGYAVVCPPDLPVPLAGEDLELKRIYLLHRFQGSGMGAALMRWSEETARAMGMRRLLLGVNDENDSAVAFYLRHGFEHAGTRRFQVGNMLCSDFILAKRLDG
jgi:GNAT superfamily N-acetyltransferase